MQDRDVRVTERTQQPGFPFQTSNPLDVGRDRVQKNIDGDATIERRVRGLPDRTHAPLADLLDQAVVDPLLSGFEGQRGLSETEIL